MNLQLSSPLPKLLQLRHFSITMQLLTVEFVDYFHDLPNDREIYAVIFCEALLHILFYLFYKKQSEVSERHIFSQLLFDIAALSALIFITGATINPFASALMLPVIFGAITLSLAWFVPLWLCSVSSYSYMAYTVSSVAEPHIQYGYNFGVWVNFMVLITTVSVVVKALVLSLNQREAAIAKYRENQLRKEQILTLGSVATQMAHELATPIATLTFIHEELQEQPDDIELIEAMREPLHKCHTNLEAFREKARQLRAGQKHRMTMQQLGNELKSAAAFELPEAKLNIRFMHEESQLLAIASDSTLIPAILNLIANAHRANQINHQNQIDLYMGEEQGLAKILIQDQGKGFNDEQLKTIGKSIQNSDTGLGIAAMLSHATIERLGGSLCATNHQQGGALVSIALPLIR